MLTKEKTALCMPACQCAITNTVNRNSKKYHFDGTTYIKYIFEQTNCTWNEAESK